MNEPYELFEPTSLPAPLLVDSPHSGRLYPADFGHAAPLELLRRAEDGYVDQLLAAVPRHGACLLAANFPRSYIDANRAIDEIDPELLAEPWPEPLSATEKTRLGIGLVRRVVAEGIPIYARQLSVAEVKARIERCWRPYRERLAALLDERRRRFGGVVWLDVHSMKSVANRNTPDAPGTPRPDVVLGDLHGRSCAPWLTAFVAEALGAMGYRVAVNWPYAGADLLRSYADPARGVHGLQLEVNRRLYLDELSCEPHAGLPGLARDLESLLAGLAARARLAFTSPIPLAGLPPARTTEDAP